MARIRLQVFLGDESPGDKSHKIGPGKIDLLEAIGEHGSISAAARAMEMAYRHAWEMADDLNQCFETPVVEAATGGASGGGARLTTFGEALVKRFRSMERDAHKALRKDLAALDARRVGARRRRG